MTEEKFKEFVGHMKKDGYNDEMDEKYMREYFDFMTGDYKTEMKKLRERYDLTKEEWEWKEIQEKVKRIDKSISSKFFNVFRVKIFATDLKKRKLIKLTCFDCGWSTTEKIRICEKCGKELHPIYYEELL